MCRQRSMVPSGHYGRPRPHKKNIEKYRCSFIPLCFLCQLARFQKAALFLLCILCANTSVRRCLQRLVRKLHKHCCNVPCHDCHESLHLTPSLSLPLSHTSTCLHVSTYLSAYHGHKKKKLTLHGSRCRRRIPFAAWRSGTSRRKRLPSSCRPGWDPHAAVCSPPSGLLEKPQ